MTAMSKTILGVIAAAALAVPAFEARAATYGCFKVTVGSLHIRERPYSSAKVLTTASKGDILEKRKYFCTPRGFWCAVRQGAIEGYADKAFMKKVPCP
jgi:hypothetical protein